jgi:hypothetical protein
METNKCELLYVSKRIAVIKTGGEPFSWDESGENLSTVQVVTGIEAA